jgi:hypothetical protein
MSIETRDTIIQLSLVLLMVVFTAMVWDRSERGPKK